MSMDETYLRNVQVSSKTIIRDNDTPLILPHDYTTNNQNQQTVKAKQSNTITQSLF